ncbi:MULTISPECIES: phage antirepressor KilAC domain-containing protein [Aeromonas]|uniref:phage antirepressor KilAC domain-containing protein n=1 Tax=Aeromonas TaxID=642 RepID=UPI001118A042|nr:MULTISPECIES: phage regulatory protein/antirepressor Ant [Aeromonas]TNI33510.1 DNA-binding protein [Aeromonas veronii]
MTNLSLINNSSLTMSSVEIAELTGKEHKNVLADIRKMLVEIQSAEKPADYKDGRGRTQPCLLLTKEESLCLVAGYSATLRMAIIRRWQELESQQRPQIPQTYAAALLEAGRLALEVEEKTKQLALAAPKVAFADRVAGDDKGVNIGNYARAVGLGQNVLFRALREHRILMSGGNRHNLPFQDYIERGYFTVKEGTRTHNDETITTFTPMVTGKGQQWLTKRLIDLGYLKPIAA